MTGNDPELPLIKIPLNSGECLEMLNKLKILCGLY